MSTSRAPFVEACRLLGRAASALAPYRNHLLVIGGMVPLLYRSVPDFARSKLPVAGTTEVDVSVPLRLDVIDGQPIAQLLEAAGFVAFEAPGYRGAPGAQAFQDKSIGAQKKAPSYVEFLTPLRGKSEQTLRTVQPCLRAEALRYLDLLAHDPIDIELSQIPEVQIAEQCSIRVPQPALYVAQKVLSRSSGRASHPEKAAKDLAYMYDVALLCEPVWGPQADLLGRAANEAHEWHTWLARAERELRALFSQSTADGPVETVRIYRDLVGEAAPTEDEVRRLVSQFADEVFRIGR